MAYLEKIENKWASFNGSSSYIQYADADVFSFTDGVNDLPFSIEFDVYVKSFNATYYYIVAKYGSNYEWDIGLVSKHPTIYLRTAGTSSPYTGAYTIDVLQINTFYRIKFTYNGNKLVPIFTISINNIDKPLILSSSGVYAGMTNTTTPVNIGNRNGSFYFDGYLRNLKITKNNQLVFHAPLQDTNNISKDIIGGLVATTVNAVSVTDINEGGNWSYFNGTTSQSYIGSTSTLGWMNSGTFNMQFDIIILRQAANNLPIYTTNGVNTNRGIMFSTSGGLYLYWDNGTLTQYIAGPAITNGIPYHVTVSGNGTQIKYQITNLFTGIEIFNSGWVNWVYVPFATTTYSLRFGYPYYSNVNLRNFKIFTDTAGTTPFMSLPMQSKDDLMIDRVSGLVGTQTDVKIINNNTNVLKAQNKWGYFNNTYATITIPDNDNLSFVSGGVDVSFEIELDIILNNVGTLISGHYYNFILSKRTLASNVNIEWELITYDSKIYILLFGSNNATIYIGGLGNTILTLNKNYHVKCVYDGSKTSAGFNIYINNIKETITTGGTGVYIGMTNTIEPLYIGKWSTYNSNVYLRNIKITKAGQLVFHLPLQDPLNIGKDIVGGLNGTVTNVSVVNQIETQNWAYFNGVNSVASIGTTSTLGWMNAGIFYMELEFSLLAYVGSATIVSTTNSSALRGFALYDTFSPYMTFYWSNGTSYVFNTSVFNTWSYGNIYKFVVRGDGSKIYYTTYNSDGSVNKTNEPTGTVVSFSSGTTTGIALQFSRWSTGNYANSKIRNFKIFTDFAGTIPFLSLPMQDAPTLMTDRITGLQGTAYNVSIVNNNTNVLRSKNLWAKFDGTTSALSIGTTSTLGWMNSGIFRLQFEVILLSLTNNRTVFTTLLGAYTHGILIRTNGTELRLSIGNGTAYLIDSAITTGAVIGNKYSVVIYGDGVNKVYYIVYNANGSINKSGNSSGAIAFVPNSTTNAIPQFSHPSIGYANNYIKNFKIFTDSQGKVPFMNLPLTDGGNIGKDIVGGLQGTATNVNVVEI